jgi:hypothetical protein
MKENKKRKRVKLSPFNRQWRPLGLGDVEAKGKAGPVL